eukprot:gene1228-2700_t
MHGYGGIGMERPPSPQTPTIAATRRSTMFDPPYVDDLAVPLSMMQHKLASHGQLRPATRYNGTMLASHVKKRTRLTQDELCLTVGQYTQDKQNEVRSEMQQEIQTLRAELGSLRGELLASRATSSPGRATPIQQ